MPIEIPFSCKTILKQNRHLSSDTIQQRYQVAKQLLRNLTADSDWDIRFTLTHELTANKSAMLLTFTGEITCPDEWFMASIISTNESKTRGRLHNAACAIAYVAFIDLSIEHFRISEQVMRDSLSPINIAGISDYEVPSSYQ